MTMSNETNINGQTGGTSAAIGNLSRIWSHWILHPIFFALYIVLALLANNIYEVEIIDSLRTVIFSAGLAVLLLLIWRPFLKNWHRSGIMASLCVLLIGLYGHVYFLLKPVTTFGIVIGRHRYLLIFWLVVLFLGVLR